MLTPNEHRDSSNDPPPMGIDSIVLAVVCLLWLFVLLFGGAA